MVKNSVWIVLMTVLLGLNARGSADAQFGYHVRLSWVGTSEMLLIMRHPDEAGQDVEFAPRDCYEGQPNPDWGIKDQSFDDPTWIFTRDGVTNYQHIFCEDLFDIGTYMIIARAFSGGATCMLDIVRWKNEDENSRVVKYLTTDQNGTREWRSQRESVYYNMYSRILKFKQKKNGRNAGKFLIKCNYTKLAEELDTNDFMRVYLNEDQVFYDEGHWMYNKKKTKYKIDKPWSVKLFMKNKNEFYIRGIAKNLYKSSQVNCNIVIGEYLGTNAFLTDKRCKYKYKENEILNP